MSKQPTNAVIVERLEHLIKIVQEHITRDDLRFEDLDTKLHGDGNGKIGALTRIDRLEQTDKERTWHIRTLWVAVLGGILTWLGGQWK